MKGAQPAHSLPKVKWQERPNLNEEPSSWFALRKPCHKTRNTQCPWDQYTPCHHQEVVSGEVRSSPSFRDGRRDRLRHHPVMSGWGDWKAQPRLSLPRALPMFGVGTPIPILQMRTLLSAVLFQVTREAPIPHRRHYEFMGHSGDTVQGGTVQALQSNKSKFRPCSCHCMTLWQLHAEFWLLNPWSGEG